jgi:hypothetical protein
MLCLSDCSSASMSVVNTYVCNLLVEIIQCVQECIILFLIEGLTSSLCNLLSARLEMRLED